MKRVESFKIKPSETLELVPGGRHLMLFDPQRQFSEGEDVKLSFLINKTKKTVSFKMVPRVKKH
ncbi:MAG: copper chaperone PCu(A)C [Bdellovibrionaceae bacterium]|nr:copper chaperone PCu(A)C [Pseudobdellovibrionaceae bacterium]